jgi:hypothetical protein
MSYCHHQIKGQGLHRLVLQTFDPHKDYETLVVAHSTNPPVPDTCCCLDRLRWLSPSANSHEHSGLHSGPNPRRGVTFPKSKKLYQVIIGGGKHVDPGVAKKLKDIGYNFSKRGQTSVSLRIVVHGKWAEKRAFRCAGILEALLWEGNIEGKGAYREFIEGDPYPKDEYEFLALVNSAAKRWKREMDCPP